MNFGFQQAADKNRWAVVRPNLKLLLGFSFIVLSLIVPNPWFGFFVCAFTAVVLAIYAGIAPRKFFAAYKLPAIFIVIGLVTLLMEFGTFPIDKPLLFTWGETRGLFISEDGLQQTIRLSSKVIGSLAGLFMISLTCSLVDVLQTLKTWHVPGAFITMMELIYRFSMSLYEHFQNLITAQEQRLAFSRLKHGIPALGQGLGRLFSRLLHKSERTAIALDLRLYQGSLNTLPIHYPKRAQQEKEILGAFLVLLLAALAFSFYRP